MLFQALTYRMFCVSMSKTHELVKGIYSTNQPNKEILLTEESVEIKHRDIRAHGDAEVSMKLLPNPRIIMKIKLQNFPYNPFELIRGKPVIAFASRKVPIETIITNIVCGPKEYIITAIPSKEPIIFSTSKNASRIVFHLLNFPNFLGPQQVFRNIDGKPYPRGRVILEYDDWQIIINAVMDFKKLNNVINQLRGKGGFFITHVGMIKKSNEKAFKISEVCKILDALDYYLSFCTGYFTSTLLAVGFNNKDEQVWERWGVRWADPWQQVPSWFDHHHGKLLAEVFPGFLSLWKNETWKKPIENAIYWYLKSNTQSGGTDGSIVLAQAALELLSWVFLTEEQKALSSEGFKLLHADDLIRLLVSSQNIKLEVFPSRSELAKLSRELTWDGPKAITEVRNFIIHPGKENKRLASRDIPYYEVLNLALWYIELVLLHLFKHIGIYANRLETDRFIGQISSVPWIIK